MNTISANEFIKTIQTIVSMPLDSLNKYKEKINKIINQTTIELSSTQQKQDLQRLHIYIKTIDNAIYLEKFKLRLL